MTTTALRNLTQQRIGLAREMRNRLEQNPGALWTKARQALHDVDVDTLEEIDAKMHAAEIRARELGDGITVTDFNPRDRQAITIFDKFVRHGERSLTPEDRAMISNTMSTTTGSQGGFTVPSPVAQSVADFQKYFSAVRDNCEVVTTETGDPNWSYPSSDGTSELGELIAENASVTSADPSFSNANIPTYKISSKTVTVPLELLYDNGVKLAEEFLPLRLASRIGRTLNTYFTVGTGTNQPQGFVPLATIGKTGTTGQTLTIIYDDIVDLVHSVDPAYRKMPGTAFMLSDSAFKVIRKLKDTTNARPIFLPSDGIQPETLLGYPVAVNNDVPVMAVSARSVFFGNWKGYVIRDSLQMSIFRFDDSAFTKLGQVGFLAILRSGGNLVDTAAIRCYANSAT